MSKNEYTYRTNEFFLILYCLDFDKIDFVLKSKINQIQAYAYILHDKDTYDKDKIDEDTGQILRSKGTLKEPHIHLYLKLFQSRLNNEIENWFKLEYNGQIQGVKSEKVKSTGGCIHYLIHDTKQSKNKVQYSVDDIVSYGISLEENDIPYDKTYEILNDYMSNTPLVELVRRYGRDFLYHYTCYKTIRNDIITTAVEDTNSVQVVPTSEEDELFT